MKLEQSESDSNSWKDRWQYTLLRPEWLRASWVRLRDLFLPFSVFSLAGCSTLGRMLAPPPSVGQQVTSIATEVSQSGGELAMLSWVGGVSTLAGIATLVLTRGVMGMRAIIIGICLVVLNFVIANYLSWFLIPVLVVSGAVSVAWGYKTIREYLEYKDGWIWDY